ncbi:MAG: zinc-binding dehydrogenase, partial [Candidatus Omnitrophota bacterium]
AIAVGRKRRSRLELARKFGADLTINLDEVVDLNERVNLVKEISTTGYGADVVFECAGVPAAFAEGIKYLRDSAVLCEVGHFTDSGSVAINPCRDILEKNITIEGIYDNEAEQFMRAVPIIEQAAFPLEDMISHRLPLRRLPEAIDAANDGKIVDGKEVVKAVMEPAK